MPLLRPSPGPNRPGGSGESVDCQPRRQGPGGPVLPKLSLPDSSQPLAAAHFKSPPPSRSLRGVAVQVEVLGLQVLT